MKLFYKYSDFLNQALATTFNHHTGAAFNFPTSRPNLIINFFHHLWAAGKEKMQSWDRWAKKFN